MRDERENIQKERERIRDEDREGNLEGDRERKERENIQREIRKRNS